MLTDLDKKLKAQIDREIYKKGNRKESNISNIKLLSLGWIFVLDIFLFVALGCFMKKYVIDSNFVFISVMVVGIIFAFFNLKNMIKISTFKKQN